MKTGKPVERMDQKGQTAEAAVLSNGLSCLAKDVARTEVSQDTCILYVRFNAWTLSSIFFERYYIQCITKFVLDHENHARTHRDWNTQLAWPCMYQHVHVQCACMHTNNRLMIVRGTHPCIEPSLSRYQMSIIQKTPV